jgi:hypothetical protein
MLNQTFVTWIRPVLPTMQDILILCLAEYIPDTEQENVQCLAEYIPDMDLE